MLTSLEKKYLLALARKTIEQAVSGKKYKKEPYYSDSLKQNIGVFVTLEKNDELRGCIGYVEGIAPLQDAVQEMAEAAALQDPRFEQVQPHEMDEIKIEISVLSVLKQITEMEKIEIGTHGLVIEQNFRKGLLLPQVATDYHWDKFEFLEQTCRKAGLPADAWQDDDCKIFIFSAEIFAENN